MKTFLVAAVLAVSVTPAMAGNGWNYGSTSSVVNCKQNSYGSKYNSYDSWSNRSNNYGSNYGSRIGSSKHNHWPTTSYNVLPARFNSSSSYYDYNAPAVRNTRYESQYKNNLTFSPWTPARSFNYGRYGY